MNEDEAHEWVADRFGGQAHDRLKRFADLLTVENGVQNLIAPSTMLQIWVRHIVDSAQLLDLVPVQWSTWLDIGTGGGFPGMVVAALAPEKRVTMAEPRRRRAEFLANAVEALGLPNATVEQTNMGAVSGHFDIVSARAVASLRGILSGAAACAATDTIWVLPRGEIDDLTRQTLGALTSTVFHVEQSITNPASAILILEGSGR